MNLCERCAKQRLVKQAAHKTRDRGLMVNRLTISHGDPCLSKASQSPSISQPRSRKASGDGGERKQ